MPSCRDFRKKDATGRCIFPGESSTTNVLLASRPQAAGRQKGGLQLGIGAAEGGANY
jgi:hypothetical protein